MLPSDVYSQPHAADPVLEERTVLDIVRGHGVHCSAVTRVDETGGEARAYVLDDNIVLKVQRPHRLAPGPVWQRRRSSCISLPPTRTLWSHTCWAMASMRRSNT
jgi:hypothetical protein